MKKIKECILQETILALGLPNENGTYLDMHMPEDLMARVYESDIHSLRVFREVGSYSRFRKKPILSRP